MKICLLIVFLAGAIFYGMTEGYREDLTPKGYMWLGGISLGFVTLAITFSATMYTKKDERERIEALNKQPKQTGDQK